MPSDKIKPEDIAGWHTPHAALTIVAGAFGTVDVAKHAILERLVAGFIRSAALKSQWKTSGRTDDEKTGVIEIPNDHWEYHKHSAEWSTFWTTADMGLTFGRTYGLDASRSVRYLAIRLDPEGVSEMLANAPAREGHFFKVPKIIEG